MDRIQAVKLFIRVVDLGSFSKAAADLGIGQPSATKQVAQLETQLGSRLLHRSTHGVAPTEIGLLYCAKCKLIAHHVEEAESVAALLHSQVQGGLRISTPVGFGRRVLVPLVMRFMKLNRKLQIELGFEDRDVDLVEQGIDIAIRMGRLSLPPTAPVLDLPGAQFIEWGGALRWLRTSASAAAVRAAAARAGGHATLFRGADKSAGAMAPLSAPLMRIHRELKAAFDPAGIFNPGRLYADL